MAGKLSFLIFQCLLSILFKHSLAFVFIDVPPEPSSSFSKRNDHSSLDLQNDEIFIYGSKCVESSIPRSPSKVIGPNNNSAAHANFTVSMTNGSEAIVSLERFGRLLSSIECTNTSMTFQFKDNGAFLYAQRAWSWVNQDSRTLIIVAGTRQCGWNTHRLPFAVTSAKFDNSSMTADLAAKPEKWSDVAHTSELWVGNKQAPPPSRFTRRDFDEILAIDFEHPLPISSWEIPFDKVPNTTFTMECESCGTHGQFDFIFHFQTVANIPTGVSFTLNPKGVSASITPAIKMQINVFDKISTPLLKLGSIPLSGISIPGDILNLGPEIVIEAGAVVGPVTTTATLSGGLEIDIPDSAQLNLGLTSPSFSASGWNPTVKPIPLTIDAEVKGTVEAFVQFSTQLSFETIGT